VEEASFAGKPLGYRDSDEDANASSPGEDPDIADFFARQIASRAFTSDMLTFAPQSAPAPRPLSSATDSHAFAPSARADRQFVGRGGENRDNAARVTAGTPPGAAPDPSYYVAAGQALAAAIFGATQGISRKRSSGCSRAQGKTSREREKARERERERENLHVFQPLRNGMLFGDIGMLSAGE
jgi:hypothetical protein